MFLNPLADMFCKTIFASLLLLGAMFTHAEKVEKVLEVESFSGLVLSGASSVLFVKSDVVSVSVNIERDYMPRVKAKVRHSGNLELDVHEKGWFGGSAVGEFTVKAPTLDYIEVSGSGSFVGDILDAESLRIEVNGSGDVKLDEINTRSLGVSVAGSGDIDIGAVTAVSLNAEIMGSGDITTAGAVAKARIEILGSGEFNGSQLDTEYTKGDIIGSGDIVVRSAASSNFQTIGSGRGKVLKEAP